MNTRWLIAPAWIPLLHALFHTLWQGALAAGVLFVALHVIPARRANLRYAVAVMILGIIFLAGTGTWLLLVRPSVDPELARPAKSVIPAKVIVDGMRKLPHAVFPVDQPTVEPWTGWAAGGWLLGVAMCLIRVGGGLFSARNLQRRGQEWTDPRILAVMDELRAGIGLRRCVRVFVSTEIRVPSVMGVFWPVILLPATMLTGVAPEVLRAVLAHELAHVRRHDYLVNLAQMVVEALLFFNPFVWWISRRIRFEREACCDEAAAGVCRSTASYVEALVAVIVRCRQHAAGERPAALLGVIDPKEAGAGTDGALERIRRLLIPGHRPAVRLRWFHGVLLATILGAVLLTWWLDKPKRTALSSGKLFADVWVQKKRFQVLVEEYPNGRKVLTVVNSHRRQAQPTRVSSLQVRLFSGTGSEVPSRPILGDTEFMARWDQGWRTWIIENSQYDLGNANLNDLSNVQLVFHGKNSARIKLRGYQNLDEGRKGVPHFDEKDYVHRQATLRLYSVQWNSPTKYHPDVDANRPARQNEAALPEPSDEIVDETSFTGSWQPEESM